MEEVCSLCFKIVAPFDRAKQQINGRVFHGDCLLNHQLSVREVLNITSRKRFRLKDLFHRSPRG